MALQDLTTEPGMLTHLQNNIYPNCFSVSRLPEGAGGFVYRAQLSDPPSSIVIKHVQPYAARSPQWKLDAGRMAYEHATLMLLAQPEMLAATKLVKAPKVLHYDPEQHVLIMEDAGSVPSLKGWVQRNVRIETCRRIGDALGRFLANLHNRTAADAALRARFNGNETAKYISGAYYFGRFPAAAASFGYTGSYFTEAAQEGEREVHESNEVLSLGDFWTGNILVSGSPEKDDPQLTAIDFELAKPGTAAFDVGQMAAEMYCLATFRDGERGSALLEGFLEAYRDAREGRVDPAKVAVRIAVHLFVIVPSAWPKEASEQQIKDVLAIGAELVRMGHDNDLHGLRKSIVKALV